MIVAHSGGTMNNGITFLEEQAIWWELLGKCGGQAVSRINNGPRATLRVCVRQALCSMKKITMCLSFHCCCLYKSVVRRQDFSSALCAVFAANSMSAHYESHMSCKQEATCVATDRVEAFVFSALYVASHIANHCGVVFGSLLTARCVF